MSNALATRSPEQLEAVVNTVKRARVNDQNAIAMLIVLRRAAAAGNAKAKEALRMAKEYIDKHPVVNNCRLSFGCTPTVQKILNRLHSRMGGESTQYVKAVIEDVPQIPDAHHAAVALANNGDLLHDKRGKVARTRDANPRIKGILNKLAPQCHDSFMYGMESCNKSLQKLKPQGNYTPDSHRALHIGRAVGMARKIQAIRLPNIPIATISPMAAWELGE